MALRNRSAGLTIRCARMPASRDNRQSHCDGTWAVSQGLDSTVAYLGVIYFLLIWLPPQRHDMVPGMVTAIGTLGAATAQLPLLVISERFGWRMPLRPARLQE